jgi:AraC family transcriptional regulator
VFSLITAGAQHRSRRQHASEVLVLGLEPRFVQALAERMNHGGRVEFRPRFAAGDPAIRHLLLALWTELQAGCPSGRLFGEGLATALTVHLLQHHAVVPARSDPHRGGLPPAQLRRVLDHVEAHLGEDTSLRRLAALVQLSPHHFATVFKQSTGLAPHQYVLRRRIEKTKELLTSGRRLSLAEVGYAAGFASQAHFTVMFRKLVGTTPGAYRVGR